MSLETFEDWLAHKSPIDRRLPKPPMCDPGDTMAAAKYLNQIDVAMEHFRFLATKREKRSLYRLRVKWERRAQGKDAAFMVIGTIPGFVTKGEREQIAIVRKDIEAGKRFVIRPNTDRLRRYDF